jgi:hypothetical protein
MENPDKPEIVKRTFDEAFATEPDPTLVPPEDAEQRKAAPPVICYKVRINKCICHRIFCTPTMLSRSAINEQIPKVV